MQQRGIQACEEILQAILEGTLDQPTARVKVFDLVPNRQAVSCPLSQPWRYNEWGRAVLQKNKAQQQSAPQHLYSFCAYGVDEKDMSNLRSEVAAELMSVAA